MHQTSHWVPGQWMLDRSKLAIRAGSRQGMGMASGLLAWPGAQDLSGPRIGEVPVWMSGGFMGKMVIYSLKSQADPKLKYPLSLAHTRAGISPGCQLARQEKNCSFAKRQNNPKTKKRNDRKQHKLLLGPLANCT